MSFLVGEKYWIPPGMESRDADHKALSQTGMHKTWAGKSTIMQLLVTNHKESPDYRKRYSLLPNCWMNKLDLNSLFDHTYRQRALRPLWMAVAQLSWRPAPFPRDSPPKHTRTKYRRYNAQSCASLQRQIIPMLQVKIIQGVIGRNVPRKKTDGRKLAHKTSINKTKCHWSLQIRVWWSHLSFCLQE